MSDENSSETRRRRYGHEETLKQCLLVLSMAIDSWPNAPSDETLALVMVPSEAQSIVAQVRRFGKRITKSARAEAA